MQAAPICIEYDDDATDIIVKINKALKSRGMILVDDDLPHNGYCLFTLQDIAKAVPAGEAVRDRAILERLRRSETQARNSVGHLGEDIRADCDAAIALLTRLLGE